MDPLTAFSLACGVIQVVDFSIKLLSKSREVYKNGSLVENKEIELMAKHLANLRTDLNISPTAPSPGNTKQLFDDEKELKDLAIKCSETSHELIAELHSLRIQGPSRKRQALARGLKVLLKKGTIEDIQKKLDRYQKILDTRILVNLRQQINLVSIRQGENFRRLDARVQNLVIDFTQEQNGIQALQEQLRKETSSTNEHISQQFKHHREELADNEFRKRCLESLYFPEIKARQEEITEAHESTFQWMFDDAGQGVRRWDNFVQWLESGRGIYWISGKPGSGKSTLMSYICEDSRTMSSLRVWSGAVEVLTPTFFFWNPGSAMQKSSAGLLRSLVYQIVEALPHLIPMLADSDTSETPSGPFAPANHRIKTISAWTEWRLQVTLQRIIHELASSRACFFIDGLDEFIGNYSALIELIEDMIQNPNVKVCVSSRPYRSFEDAFGHFPKLKLQDLTEQDMRVYATDRLSSLSRTKLLVAGDLTWIPETVDKILEKAEGVFLWVRLAVDDQIEGAKDEDKPEQLAERLELLPNEMGDLYVHMLNKISKSHRKEAVRYLQLVLHRKLYSPSGLQFYENRKDSLMKIALAVYDKLEDLLCLSSEINIPDVMAHCDRTAKRIANTCAGFLEIYSDSESESDLSESGATEPPINETKRVRFLHRTTADFLLEDERGKKFLDINSTMDFDLYTSDTRAELGFLIVFLVSRRSLKSTAWGFREEVGAFVDSVMESACHAEEKTGVAQIVLMDHVDNTIAKLIKRYDNEAPPLHWCTRWVFQYSVYLDRSGKTTTSGEFKPWKRPSSGSIPTRPVDFLGHAAHHGLVLYVQQKLETRQDLSDPHTASYLLCCAVGILQFSMIDQYIMPRDLKRLELIAMLLKRGADPNTVAFDIFEEPSEEERSQQEAWAVASLVSRTGIKPTGFSVKMKYQHSALSVIEKFIGHAPGLEEIQSIFKAKGAYSYSKCLHLRLGFGDACPEESYALSQQQSDYFLRAWELMDSASYGFIEPAALELGRVIEELHQELKSQSMDPDDCPNDDDDDDDDEDEDEDEEDLLESVYYSMPSTPTD